MAKARIIRTNHRATEWESNLTNYIPVRKLLSKIYKEPNNLYIKKKSNKNKNSVKMGYRAPQRVISSKTDSQMAKKQLRNVRDP